MYVHSKKNKKFIAMNNVFRCVVSMTVVEKLLLYCVILMVGHK